MSGAHTEGWSRNRGAQQRAPFPIAGSWPVGALQLSAALRPREQSDCRELQEVRETG